MNRERLEKMIEVLERVPEESFDLSYWKRPSFPWQEDGTNPCGFVACAVGHCALDPWFNEQGLSLVRPVLGANQAYPELQYKKGKKEEDGFKGSLYQNMEAVEHFFEISLGTAVWLFLDPSYLHTDKKDGQIKPKDVVARIRKVLDGNYDVTDYSY